MDCILTSIISPLLSLCGGLRTNSLESLILDNKGHTALDVSFFAHSHLSKLRHLELFCCTIPSWDHLTSQTTLLTTLKLFLQGVSPALTMPQLLSMLVSNPHLEKLEIYPVPNSNSDDDGFRSVPLQHLEELRLDGDTGQVFGLLSRLEHPEEMTAVTFNISHCVIADVLQMIGPYMDNHLRRRGRSQNGLGLCLSSSSFISFALGDGVGLYPSASEFLRMTSFLSLCTQWAPGLNPPRDIPRLWTD